MTYEEICPACAGSGEGNYDGSICTLCHGEGVILVEEQEDDEAM